MIDAKLISGLALLQSYIMLIKWQSFTKQVFNQMFYNLGDFQINYSIIYTDATKTPGILDL
jgi:hypothetical protein